MINCKIGVVAKKREDESSYIFLGEIFSSEIRQDEKMLYELHTNLRYLYPFRCIYNKGKILLDNMEDIYSLQDRYKLTKKIYTTEQDNKPVYTVKYLRPELYDISCMVPLFSEIQPRHCIHSQSKQTNIVDNVFIILPYLDPIIRGELVNSCITTLNDEKGMFVCIGGKQGENKMKIGSLVRRYLLSCKVKDEDIIIQEFDEFPDSILEALIILSMIIDKETRIFFAVDKKEIDIVLRYVRISRNQGLIDRKIQFICN